MHVDNSIEPLPLPEAGAINEPPPLTPGGPAYVSPPDAPEPGTVVAGSETRYASYGEVRTDGEAVAGLTDFTYASQQVDRDTGLMYYNARWYDPALGRFISPDTVVPEPGNPQALNRYAYVANNPLRYVDPTGHGWFDEALVVLGQRSSIAKGLLVGVSEAAESISNPERSPTMEGIRQTARGVTEGIKAWGDIVGMTGVALDYTASAISEGRWEDAARGAAGLNQMGQTVGDAVGYATTQAVVGIATAPFRDAWAFGVAAREYAQGERSGWDMAFHSLCLTGDVLAIGAMYSRVGAAGQSAQRARVEGIADDILDWVGQGDDVVAIYNEHGDLIIRSVGNTRRFQAHFNYPYPHENPHFHFQWIENSNSKTGANSEFRV